MNTWYHKGMTNNTYSKSSITLPPSELAIVNSLKKKLKAKSKVEVIRLGLRLLQQNYEAGLLEEQFRDAARIVKESNRLELNELDPLSAEGLPDED